MIAALRQPQLRSALALILVIAVPLSACQSVEVSEERSPGTVGSVKVHIHNGLFDEVPQPGYSVSLYKQGARGAVPDHGTKSVAGQPTWLRAVEPGLYTLEVRYGEPNGGAEVYEEKVSVKSDTITCLRIESRAHEAIEIRGDSGGAGLAKATTDLLGGIAYGLGAVIYVGLLVGVATLPIWLPFATGKAKKD